MNFSKLLTPLCCLLIMVVFFTSCSTYKKKRYIKKNYKEIKKSFPDSEVNLIKDSIKVIFPNNLVFGIGSAEVLGTFENKLNRFAGTLTKYDRSNLLITGHTDNSGEEEMNMRLSLDRANNVKTYLISKKVKKERLFTWGLGEKSPLTSNATDNGKSKNRRVEFVVLYNPKN